MGHLISGASVPALSSLASILAQVPKKEQLKAKKEQLKSLNILYTLGIYTYVPPRRKQRSHPSRQFSPRWEREREARERQQVTSPHRQQATSLAPPTTRPHLPTTRPKSSTTERRRNNLRGLNICALIPRVSSRPDAAFERRRNNLKGVKDLKVKAGIWL